jgi:hypothetical protein
VSAQLQRRQPYQKRRALQSLNQEIWSRSERLTPQLDHQNSGSTANFTPIRLLPRQMRSTLQLYASDLFKKLEHGGWKAFAIFVYVHMYIYIERKLLSTQRLTK